MNSGAQRHPRPSNRLALRSSFCIRRRGINSQQLLTPIYFRYPFADFTTKHSINFNCNCLRTAKTFAGARTVVDKQQINQRGATSTGDVMQRIPGVQATNNPGTAGSAISLNIGVRGLTGCYTPRSTVLLDDIPLAVAPYGQPQLSFAPVSLGNIESMDVVRSGGAVRYGPQNRERGDDNS